MATLTISLRKRLVRIHETRRRKASVNYLRQEIARHSKVDADAVKLGMDVNEYLIRNVAVNMKPVMLNLEKSPAGVTAHLADSLKNWKGTRAPAAQKPEVPAAKKKEQATQAAMPDAAPKAHARPAPKPTEPKKAKPDEKKQV